jgi:hypothetical protein
MPHYLGPQVHRIGFNALMMSGSAISPQGAVRTAAAIKGATVPQGWHPSILNRGEGENITAATVGIPKECIHGYAGGEGCYLCDVDHPYRKANPV